MLQAEMLNTRMSLTIVFLKAAMTLHADELLARERATATIAATTRTIVRASLSVAVPSAVPHP